MPMEMDCALVTVGSWRSKSSSRNDPVQNCWSPPLVWKSRICGICVQALISRSEPADVPAGKRVTSVVSAPATSSVLAAMFAAFQMRSLIFCQPVFSSKNAPLARPWAVLDATPGLALVIAETGLLVPSVFISCPLALSRFPLKTVFDLHFYHMVPTCDRRGVGVGVIVLFRILS